MSPSQELAAFEVNGDGDKPVTRREFAEAMHLIARAFDHTATKEDLKAYATKDDLKAMEKRIDAKIEQSVGRAFEKYFDKWGEEIKRYNDVQIENRMIDLGAARNEEVLLIREKQDRHEHRITAIEDRVGL